MYPHPHREYAHVNSINFYEYLQEAGLPGLKIDEVIVDTSLSNTWPNIERIAPLNPKINLKNI